jgi:hypothetical protein
MKLITLTMLLVLTACSDADIANMSANGREGTITCYSGGKAIFHAASTGKIRTEAGTDGWYFKDKETTKLVRVSGDCVIYN